MGNIFMRWWKRGQEKHPQSFLRITDTPPAPIINPAWQPTHQTMPADIQAQMHRAAREAWASWKPEALAKTVPLVCLDRTITRRIHAEQHNASILVVDGLPLMPDPMVWPPHWWTRQASEQLYTARDNAPTTVKMRLYRLCERHPERVGIALAVAYPQHSAMWAKVAPERALPVLAGMAVNTLRLPTQCVATVDPTFTDFNPATEGRPHWRLEIFERDDAQESEMAA